MDAWAKFSRRNLMVGGGAAAVAAMMLASCGGNGGSGGSGGGTKIFQWYHQYGEAGTEEAAKKYASEYKDADVQVNWVMGDYAAKLSTSLLSGQDVDVFENNAIAADQAEQGRYADLTSLVEPIADQFNEASMIQPKIGDKYWGLPMIVDPQFFYYRKSMFGKAGIQPPETWDDLVSAATELNSPDVAGLFLGNNFDACTWPMIWAAGGSPLTEDLKKTNYNNAGYVEGMTALQKMKNDGVLLTGSPADWPDPSALVNGLCAMAWGGCWELPALEDALKDDIGVFPLPAIGAEGKQVSLVNPWTEQIAGASKNIEAATAFIKWLWVDNVEAQKDWSLSYGFHIPALTSVAESAEALKDGNGAAIVEMGSSMGVSGPPQWTGDIGTPLADATSNILKNNADVAAELTKAQEAGDNELAK